MEIKTQAFQILLLWNVFNQCFIRVENADRILLYSENNWLNTDFPS